MADPPLWAGQQGGREVVIGDDGETGQHRGNVFVKRRHGGMYVLYVWSAT